MSEDKTLRALLKKEFKKEFTFLIEGFELAVPELTLPDTRETGIKKVFRSLHAIKGSARAVGFEEVGNIAHALENCMAVLRVYPERLDQVFLDCLIESVRSIDHYIANPILNISALQSMIDSQYNRLENPEQIINNKAVLHVEQHTQPPSPTEVSGDSTFKKIIERAKHVAEETAAALNKKVDFFGFGGHVQAQEKMLMQLADPIFHLIRNAIDHGIESIDKRLAAWKSERARIMLKVSVQGDFLCIYVIDDGVGLNRKNIIEHSVQMGILPNANAAHALDDTQVYSLLCEPGYTTTSHVTQISGRGVGLDIVKDRVESLGGYLEITSNVGKGSSFKMAIPLTRQK